MHKPLRACPNDRLIEELEVIADAVSRAGHRPALGDAGATGPLLAIRFDTK
jgi:hypothetical protein